MPARKPIVELGDFESRYGHHLTGEGGRDRFAGRS